MSQGSSQVFQIATGSDANHMEQQELRSATKYRRYAPDEFTM
jgi:hypothetical protein